MADFLTTSGTSHHIENVIIEATSQLVLVSPFLQLSKTLFERLKDASTKGVKIKIIYGKDDLKPNEKNSLAELKNLELFYLENLHAKCYFNETKMVITSMNMYQFSEKTNREMGVLIDSKTDKDLFDKAVNETLSIINHSEVTELHKTERKYYNQTKNAKDSRETKNEYVKPQMLGYCVRCEIRIQYDPTRPYCKDCFSSWAQWENAGYNENVCHCCGQFTNPISMSKPQCYRCNVKHPPKSLNTSKF